MPSRYSQHVNEALLTITQSPEATPVLNIYPQYLEMLWKRFHQRMPGFTDFSNPGKSFVQNETEQKRAALAKFQKKLGREKLNALVDLNRGLETRKELERMSGLIVDYRAWDDTLGTSNETISEVLREYLRATENAYAGPATTTRIFATSSRLQLAPTWDGVSMLLWVLRPTDFFPIKIRYYRTLASEIGLSLPVGRPNAEALHAVIEFGRMFWRALEPQRPSDWVDVQSFIWCVCPTSYENSADQKVEISPEQTLEGSTLSCVLRRYHEHQIIFVSTVQNRRYAVKSIDQEGVTIERLDGGDEARLAFSSAADALERLEAVGSLEIAGLEHPVAIRNTLLQEESVALTPDRSRIVHLPNNASRLENFIGVLSAMKRENPLYKPAMLSCVLDGVDDGTMTQNKIPFDWIAPRFIAKMKTLGEDITEREAAQPFYHLSNDLFWLHAVQNPKDLMQAGSDGPTAARNKIRYALLKDTYWNLLQDPDNRKVVRRELKKFMLPEPKKILPAAEKAIESTGFVYDSALLRRFIAALATKPFVILTGASGTGKTQLARLLAEWMCESSFTGGCDPFRPGAMIASDKVSYYVHRADKDSVEFWNNKNESSATKVSLPRAMITEWADEMVAQDFDSDTPARKIREAVVGKSQFSSQLHSFETHLKAAALALLATKGAESSQPPAAETYCIVPVGADWTDNRNVVGFVNYLQKENGEPIYSSTPVLDLLLRATDDSDRPYFLILDEMNLSHVERYFSDFLSAMESKKRIPLHNEKKPAITPTGRAVESAVGIPENFFVIGTVNVDETTYMFSPKVLDRANVIEFRMDPPKVISFMDRVKKNGTSRIASSPSMGMAFLELSKRARCDESPLALPQTTLFEQCKTTLTDFFVLLHSARLEFAFRTITEIFRYLRVDLALTPDGTSWDWQTCLDAQILQKLLPKMHGSRRRLEAILVALAAYCEHRDLKVAQTFLQRDSELGSYPSANVITTPAFPLSRTKLIEMTEAVRRDQFVSFIQ